jgi:hypothetical protein
LTRAARISITSLVFALALSAFGCGWSTGPSRHMTQNGVSESGYPAGSSPDPGSPAVASQKRADEHKTEAK